MTADGGREAPGDIDVLKHQGAVFGPWHRRVEPLGKLGPGMAHFRLHYGPPALISCSGLLTLPSSWC